MTASLEMLTKDMPANVGLALETSRIGNAYASMAIQLYADALAAHEAGEDLEESLFNIGSEVRQVPYHQDLALQDHEVEAIAAGEPDEREAKFAKFVGVSNRRNFYPDVDLDKEFDEQGRRVDQEERLSSAMTVFAMAVNQKDLAEFFVQKVQTRQQRLDIYLASLEFGGAASSEVTTQLFGIRKELEKEPKEYVKLLIAEIQATDPNDLVSVFGNLQELTTILESQMLKAKNIYEKRRILDFKFETAKALLSRGAERESDQIVAGIKEYDEDYKVRYKAVKTLYRASKGKIGFARRQLLRQNVRTILNTSLESEMGGNLRVYRDIDGASFLALGIMGYKGKMLHKVSVSQGDRQLAKTEVWRSGVKDVLDRNITDVAVAMREDIDDVERYFPRYRGVLSGSKLEAVRGHIKDGNHNAADEAFAELIADKRYTRVQKILGSSAMASIYSDRSDKRFDTITRAAALLDSFEEAELPKVKERINELVTRAMVDGEQTRDIIEIRRAILQIPDVSVRDELTAYVEHLIAQDKAPITLR